MTLDQPSAQSSVTTSKGVRYLKALCNHFDRKAEAHYTDQTGHIVFTFGECSLIASDETLDIEVKAENETSLERTKHVIADHLIRFGQKDELVVSWN